MTNVPRGARRRTKGGTASPSGAPGVSHLIASLGRLSSPRAPKWPVCGDGGHGNLINKGAAYGHEDNFILSLQDLRKWHLP